MGQAQSQEEDLAEEEEEEEEEGEEERKKRECNAKCESNISTNPHEPNPADSQAKGSGAQGEHDHRTKSRPGGWLSHFGLGARRPRSSTTTTTTTTHHQHTTNHYHANLAKANIKSPTKASYPISRHNNEQSHKLHDHAVRKLSNVSNRNIQLLSMKQRSEREVFADDLKSRRRSSLINLILGAPSSGPRFCDDLCSLGSRLSNFGIESFPSADPNFTNAGSYYHFNSFTVRSQPGANGTVGSSQNSLASSTQQKRGSSLLRFEASKQAEASLRPGERASIGLGATGTIRSPESGARARSSSRASWSLSPESDGRRLPWANLTSESGPATTSSAADGHNHHHLQQQHHHHHQHRRRSSEGSLAHDFGLATEPDERSGQHELATDPRASHQVSKSPLAACALASIDLMSSFEKHMPPYSQHQQQQQEAANPRLQNNYNKRPTRRLAAINKSQRPLRRSGSELSLYSNQSSCCSFNSQSYKNKNNSGVGKQITRPTAAAPQFPGDEQVYGHSSSSQMAETKLIIILQVCLPFLLAGFGNMSAGLVLSRVANWDVARHISTFLVLLPPLVGLKGNIEMTLASRLSTLANLNLLDTKYRCQRAYVSNLALILSQAIGLGLFASLIAILCEMILSSSSLNISFNHHSPSNHHGTLPNQNNTMTFINNYNMTTATLARSAADQNDTSPMMHDYEPRVLPTQMGLAFSAQVVLLVASALATSMLVALLSSVIMSCAIFVARLIQVNPDNLSTLVAALYGDVSCVLIYGYIASCLYHLMREQAASLTPQLIIGLTLALWPILFYGAFRLKETHAISVSSLPPMLTSILISMGSGAALSIVVKKYSLIALYQPIVNGFSANLIAVQASRVSTWLWCSALNEVNTGNNEHTKLPPALAYGDKGESGAPDGSEAIQERAGQPLGSLASFASSSNVAGSIDCSPTTGAGQLSDGSSQSQLDNYGVKEKSNGKRNPRKQASFPPMNPYSRILNTLFWSFTNPSPNSLAAKLLLVMLIPAHTLYFIVIWLISSGASGQDSVSSSSGAIQLTWAFYLVYLFVCVFQVFILLLLCEPFMTFLMNRGFDPDIFGISILMALADLTGTLCLTGAFSVLDQLGDVNAKSQIN